MRTRLRQLLRPGSTTVWLLWLLAVLLTAPGLRSLRVDNSLDASLPNLRSIGPYSTYIVLGWPASPKLNAEVEAALSARSEFALCVSPCSETLLRLAGITSDGLTRGIDPTYAGAFCFPKIGTSAREIHRAAQEIAALAPDAIAVGGPAAFTSSIDAYSQERMPLIVILIAVSSLLLLRWVAGGWGIASKAVAACVIAESVVLGSIGLHKEPLHLTLLIIPPLILCFGASYAAHRILRRDSGSTLFFCMLTAALGFACAAFTPVHSMRSFGIWGAYAIIITWAAVTSLLMPLVVAPAKDFLPALRAATVRLRGEHRKAILLTSVVVLIASIPAVRLLTFQSDSTKLFPAGSIIRNDFTTLNTRLTGMLPFQVRTSGEFDPVPVLNGSPAVKKVLRSSSLVPGEQHAFLCLADNGSLPELRRVFDAMRVAAAQRGESVDIIGVAAQLSATQDAVRSNAIDSLPIMLGACLTVIWFLTRRTRELLEVALILSFPIAGLIVLAAAFGIPLDLATLTIAAIAVGLSTDDAVHLTSMRRDNPYSNFWRPCVGSSLIAVLTLLPFLLSPFLPTQQFGLTLAIALFLGTLANHLLRNPDRSTSEPVRAGVDSYTSTKTRFDTEKAAARYSRKHDNARDRREQRCIAAAMETCQLADNSLVLDLPCGAGRLSPMIVDMGYRLVAADSSLHMVAQAIDAWMRLIDESHPKRDRVTFEVRDVMHTGYEDSMFDLVICNRLLHHFSESETRVCAMTELARVSKRWVIVSFFNASTFNARRKKFWQLVIGKRATNRLPIPLQQFESDAKHAGLRVVQMFPTCGKISPQWYVLLER